jgi:tetratricopeptide (TPR) repeat protein
MGSGQRMHTKENDDMAALFNRAVRLQLQGRVADALTLYDAVIRQNPAAPGAYCQRGIALDSLKRFDHALQSFDRAIALKPDFAEAHYHRGDTLKNLRRPEDAVRSYDRAIEFKPAFAEAHNSKGSALRQLNRLGEAVQSFDRAVAIKPDYAPAHYNRGNAMLALKRPNEALQSYNRAIGLKPDFADAFHNRGNALKELNRFGEAIRSYDRVIELRPGDAPAYNSRAVALRDFGRPEDAVRSADRAIQLKPDFAPAWHCRGIALQDLGRREEALLSYDRAIELMPAYATAYNNRGNALQSLDRLEEAIQNFDRAIALEPGLAETHFNKGNALKSLSRLDEAIASYGRAIALRPEYPDACWNKGTCLLLSGNFAEGWLLHEWRKKKSGSYGIRNFRQPTWTGGESLEGKTLLIAGEQGFGDTIQFCRYALLAEAGGARVILSVQDPLVRLLTGLAAGIRIVGWTTESCDFDYQVSLLSLPMAFNTNLGNCLATIPYLRAESDRVEKWQERIGLHGFKIGICWQGARGGEIDAGRSFPVGLFEAIARIPHVRLISLQKNAGVEQLHDLPKGMTVESLGDAFDNGADAFVDTAAVMESLDLVITPDTAIAHLAGALGRPAFVALKQVPDWRWLLRRADSPWYPTLRLFRQEQRGDWPCVFAAMQAELGERIVQKLRGA